MKRKVLAVLTLIAAGSVFYGTSKAEARGPEFSGIQITWTWGRCRELPPCPPPPPPPPPPHYHHHFYAPPPPHFHDRPPHRRPRYDDCRRYEPPRNNRPPHR